MWAAMLSRAKSFNKSTESVQNISREQPAQDCFTIPKFRSGPLRGAQLGLSPQCKEPIGPKSRSSLEEEVGGAQSWVSRLGVSFLQWSLVAITSDSKEVLGILSLLGPCQDRGCWGKQGCLLLWDLNLTSTFSKRLPVFILKPCWLSLSHACHDHYVQTQAKMT